MPLQGARIQVPNILITSSGAYATANANKSQLDTTNTGAIYADCVNFSDRFRASLTQPKTVKLRDVGIFLPSTISECYDTELSGVVISKDRRVNAVGLTLAAVKSDKIENILVCSMSASNAITISDSNDINIYKSIGFVHARSAATIYGLSMTTCTNLLFSGCYTIGGQNQIVSCKGITYRDHKFGDTSTGATVTTNAESLFLISAGCFDLRFANISQCISGSMVRTDIFNMADCQNVIITGFSGNLGSQAANLATIGQNSADILIASCSFGTPRTAIITNNNGALRVRATNLYGNSIGATALATLVSQNSYQDAVLALSQIGTAGTTTMPATYDAPFTTRFTSVDMATGSINLTPTGPTVRSYFSASYLSGSPYFNNNGSLIMATSGTIAEFTWDYPILGVKSFVNRGAILSGATAAARIIHEYAIKHENSESYTAYKTGSAANLFAESVDPNIGFRLKVRFTCLTGNLGNTISNYNIAYFANSGTFYPVGYVNLTLKNLVSGSRYWVYNSSSANVITSSIATTDRRFHF